MATLHQIQAALQEGISAATAEVLIYPVPALDDGLYFDSPNSATFNPLPIDVGIGWPPLNRLQDVSRGQRAAVAIYDMKVARNTTRWLPFSYDVTPIAATLTAALSRPTLIDGISPTATITFGGTVTQGDAAAIVVTNTGSIPYDADGDPQVRPSAAQVVIGSTADTPSSIASALAAAINGDAALSTWLTAAAGGAVVTLTIVAGKGPLVLAARTGNGATQEREIGRRLRHMQIACWTQTEEAREALTDPIDTYLAQSELDFGLLLPDNSYARLLYESDHYIEDATLQDVYRRDFFVSIDAPVTVIDRLYEILAPEVVQIA